jgi:hypothetical protein
MHLLDESIQSLPLGPDAGALTMMLTQHTA